MTQDPAVQYVILTLSEYTVLTQVVGVLSALLVAETVLLFLAVKALIGTRP